MNRMLSRVALAVLALTLSLSLTAFAGDKGKNITLSKDVQVNGTTLRAGDYFVKYDMNGNTAQVKFLRNNKEVANVTGQVTQLTEAPVRDSVVTQGNSISELQFRNQKSAISFDGSAGMSNGK